MISRKYVKKAIIKSTWQQTPIFVKECRIKETIQILKYAIVFLENHYHLRQL